MILDSALDLIARSFDPVGETYALRIRAGSGGYAVEHADVDDAARAGDPPALRRRPAVRGDVRPAPARRLGLLASDAPIVDSVAWVTRTNELGTPLLRADPFLIFRAVEPARPLRRVSRYLSAAPRSLLELELADRVRRRVRLDTASHLYEWGWLLYAWADPATRPVLEPTWAASDA
jgi:hypothetical protein